MKRLKLTALILTLAATVYGCSTSAENAAPLDSSAVAASNSKGAAAAPRAAAPAPKPAPTPVFKTSIPADTRLAAVLIDSLGTDTNSVNDQFLASLGEAVIVNGKTVLERGTKVRGRVVDVQESGRVKGVASIRLELTEILLGGKTIEIKTSQFSETAESTKKQDAGVIAGGAGIGAAIGAIVGGKKGAAIGAAAGGGAGTGAVLATDGKEIHYASETRINFTLARTVEF